MASKKRAKTERAKPSEEDQDLADALRLDQLTRDSPLPAAPNHDEEPDAFFEKLTPQATSVDTELVLHALHHIALLITKIAPDETTNRLETPVRELAARVEDLAAALDLTRYAKERGEHASKGAGNTTVGRIRRGPKVSPLKT